MDRAISKERIQQQWAKRILTAIGILAFIGLAYYLTRRGLALSIDGDRILISTAEIGKVAHTLTASGLVSPAFEEVISSPIQANIKEVLIPLGTEIKPGQSILALDKSFAQLDYEKQMQELQLNANSIKKTRLELKKSLFNLKITDSTQALNIAQLEAELEDAKRLEKIGGGTREEVSLIETKLKIANLEKQKLEFDLSIEQQQTEASLEDLKIQYNIQSNNVKTIKEKLDRADIVASREGILTWANENIGTTIREGEMLARVADLSSYKVIANCSDVFMDRLQRGMEVIIEINDEERTPGRIANIRPSVENNIMTFEVELEERDHQLLRPNMKVDVYVITASKSNVVRVENGPAFNGRSTKYVYVVEGNKAIRRDILVGLNSFDFVEIEKNLNPGEKVIISDMSRYENRREISID
ncbi:MAG: efflux RND transporter periplasmic adaptor subunit [Bacteroidia bacterium]|nr:efflux RND transporter periplasmic adaptor subunit [Bacteroidia bacterium]